jgi:basic amino acid/polyamine antiporter, APA family
MHTPDTAHPPLPRVLGPWLAAAIVVGTVIGTGVFKKGRNVAENVPEFGLAVSVWVLVGVLALLGSFALAEVAVRLPRAGGNYVFLREAYGRPFAFLWGWVDLGINRTASIAALAAMFTESLHVALQQGYHTSEEVLPFWPRQLITVALIVVCALVNIRGTLVGAGLQLFLTVLKVGSIIGLAVLPFLVVWFSPNTAPQPTTVHMSPTWPSDWTTVNWAGYGAAMVAVLWAYHGWQNIGPMAEEVKNPQRNLPLALIAGVLALIALYVSANAAYYSAIPRGEMKDLKDTTVATEFCLRLIGPLGGMIASLIVMTSAFGALNGNVLVGPRLLYAMGQDGMAPKWLTAVHPKYRTPAVATLMLAGWSCLMVVGLGALLRWAPDLFTVKDADGVPQVKSPFDILTDYVIFGAVIFETMAVASIFVFRRTMREQTPILPYRCWGYPVVPAVYVLIMAAVLVNMISGDQRAEAFVGLGYIATGALVYALLFARSRPVGV